MGVQSPTELTEAFRARGLKVTPQRQCIFRVLHDNDGHPTADAVHEVVTAEMPTVSLRTVYQTLRELVQMGELQALDLGTGSSRFDPNIVAHHHLVCSECGKVRDAEAELSGLTVPESGETGFDVTNVEVVFRGRCRDCATRSS